MSTLTQRKTGTSTKDAPSTIEDKVVDGQEAPEKANKFKSRPPRLPRSQRIFARIVLSAAVFVIVYYTAGKDKTITLAGINEYVELREHKADCTLETTSYEKLPCNPGQCGRFASDQLVSQAELIKMRELTELLVSKFFKSNDDKNSLAIDLLSERITGNERLSAAVNDFYKLMLPKIIESIAQRFHTSSDFITLTNPSQIFKVTNVSTEYSERLHKQHYDTEYDSSIRYTIIIYLNSFIKDFAGGKLVFVDTIQKKKSNVAVEPKAGRIIGYTASSENNYYLDKITTGASYFISLSFRCDKKPEEVSSEN